MAKRAPAPPTCAFALKQGKRFANLSPGPYKVCITPTQAETLFDGRRPKKLGCGVFACVYQHPSDPAKVVKITRDPSDVAGLQKAQGLQVPKLYDSRKLAGPAKWVTPRTPGPNDDWPETPPVYALTLEKLGVLTNREQMRWNVRFSAMRMHIENASTGPKTVPAKPGAASTVKLTIGELAKKVCAGEGAERAVQACELRIRELNKISADLAARGVSWDDIHAGNIGVDANGRWKAIDLGASKTKLRSEPPSLAGRRRR